MLSGQGLLQNKHYSNGYYVLKWFLLFFLKLHVHKLINPHYCFITRIPLYGGVLITITDTFIFLFLDKYGMLYVIIMKILVCYNT